MNRSRFILVIVLTCVATSLLSAQMQKPISWSLELPAKSKTVQPGKTIVVEMVAQLDPGWHLYSLTQGPGGPVPTQIRVPQGQQFKLAGSIEQPAPHKAFDENFGIDTEFFDGAPAFKLPVSAAANTKPGKYPFKAEVKYQICDDRMCMPPETVKLDTTIAVVK